MAHHRIIGTLFFIILVDIKFFDLPFKYFDCFDTLKYINLNIGILDKWITLWRLLIKSQLWNDRFDWLYVNTKQWILCFIEFKFSEINNNIIIVVWSNQIAYPAETHGCHSWRVRGYFAVWIFVFYYYIRFEAFYPFWFYHFYENNCYFRYCPNKYTSRIINEFSNIYIYISTYWFYTPVRAVSYISSDFTW